MRQSVAVSANWVSGGNSSIPAPIAAYGTAMIAPIRPENHRDSSAEAAIMPSDAEPNPPRKPAPSRYCERPPADPASR